MHELTRRVRGAALFSAIAVALSVVSVAAHHGWSGYGDTEFQITGTVSTPVSTAGPHASLKIKAADGQIWNVLLAPPPRTEAAGLKEGIIPVGATVTVHGHRNMTSGRYEMKTERVVWNNKVFAVYPDRH